MRYFLLTFILVYGLGDFSLAQDTLATKCIRLEGLTIGCVPAQNHPCIRTVAKNVNQGTRPEDRLVKKYECIYVPKVLMRPRQARVGSVGMNCVATRPNPEVCGGGNEGEPCNASICDQISSPACSISCAKCVEKKEVRMKSYTDAGCSIISDGTGGCKGPTCRKRCGDEPFAGGLPHDSCEGGMGGEACGPEPLVACANPYPQCDAEITVDPGQVIFRSTKEDFEMCVAPPTCPQAVGANGHGGIPWPPALPFGATVDPNSTPEEYCANSNNTSFVRRECISSTGYTGTCRSCSFNGGAGCLACPANYMPIATVQPPTGNTCADDDVPFLPQEGSQGLQCPWVSDFGGQRTNCGPIPCCCQFDDATGESRSDCGPGVCPAATAGKSSCALYLEQNPQSPGATATSVNKSMPQATPVSKKAKVKK